jgi:predicted outer membrane repeat protein
MHKRWYAPILGLLLMFVLFSDSNGSGHPPLHGMQIQIEETAPADSETICQEAIQVSSVGDSGPGTLRQAIEELCDGGEITFADEPTDSEDGFYIDLTSGELFIDKQVLIRNQRGDDLTVALSGREGSRIFKVGADAVLVLEHLYLYGTQVYEEGAAIYVAEGGHLQVRNSIFDTNRARTGGAVFLAPDSIAEFEEVELLGNLAMNQGGAISSNGTLTLTRTSVRSNSAYIGGGLHAAGVTAITDSTVEGNMASFYGSGIVNDGVMAIRTTQIVDNRSLSSNSGGIDNVGRLTLIDSRVTANQAATFAGVFNDGTHSEVGPGEMTIETSLIEANHAFGEKIGSDGVGGVGNFDGTLVIRDSTIVSNTAVAGVSGLYHLGFDEEAASTLQNVTLSNGAALTTSLFGAVTVNGGGAVTLTNVTLVENGENGVTYWAEEDLPLPRIVVGNSIVARNAPHDFSVIATLADGSIEPVDTPFPLTSAGHNLIGVGIEGLDVDSDRAGDLASPLEVQIGALQPRAGSYVHPLLPDSPAVDAGAEALCSEFDQLRVPRTGPCDIGAVELD